MERVAIKRHNMVKFMLRYGIHFLLLFFFVGVVVFYVAEYRARSQTCFTTTQVKSDSRCLYILDGSVYEKGSRSKPHHGHACGSDVSSVIPSYHLSNPAKYLTPGYVGDICTVAPTNTPTATPNPTLTPTQTPPPLITGTTTLSFSFLLHGLGNAGDAANPGVGGNKTPIHAQRSVTVQVFNKQNQLIVTKTGHVTYDQGTGVFKGTIDLGANMINGFYTVKVKSPQFLNTLVPGIQTLVAGKNNQMATVSMVNGDINNDNMLNILDYALLVDCYSDSNPFSCSNEDKQMADINDDGIVNQYDYNLFLRELTNVRGM